MQRIVAAAIAYLAPVFGLAFVLGVVRSLWLAPRLGEVGAVLVEVPLILGFAWVVGARVLRRRPLPGRAARAAMGLLALLMLLGLELALGRLAFGRPLSAILAAMATPAGLIGLAGQIGFGLIPLIQPRG